MRTRLFATGAAVVLLASACTGQPDATSGSGTAAGFTFAIPSAPVSLDVVKDFQGNTMSVLAPVTEKLELVDDKGALSPGLATKVTQPDPMTIVYTLRSGVRFSDGKPLTADDVAWSLLHVADAKAGAQTAGNVEWLAGATATGPLEVTVKTKRQVPNARGSIAVVGFIQEAAFAKAHEKDLGTAAGIPVGTGPYKITEDTPQRITLSRNPYYWGTKPRIDQLPFTIIAQDNTAQLAMRSGSLQGAVVGNLKTTGQWTAIQHTKLVKLASLYTTFLTMDTTTAPLNDLHVRKAIAYSVDRAGVMSAGYGDSATLLKGLAPPGLLTGVAPSAKAATDFLDSLPQYQLDPAKARAELAKSAYPNGFSLDVPVLAGDPASDLVVQNLAQNMKALGVTITPKNEPVNQWTATVYAHGEDLGMQTMALVPPIPDPESVLGAITGKANIRPQGFNLANWTTPATETAWGQLTTSTDKDVRWQATQTLLKAIADEVPYLPLFNPDTVVALGGGFTFDRELSLFDLYVNGVWASALRSA